MTIALLTGRRRLITFIIIFGGLGFTTAIFGFILPFLYENKQSSQTVIDSHYNELAAAILGGMISVSPFAYREYIQVPQLEIIWKSGSDDLLAPINTVALNSGSTMGTERKFLRVVVTNQGYKAAKACSATIRLDKDGKIDKCSAFSTEPKALLWAFGISDRQTTVDIPPYDAEQYLEVVFSDNVNLSYSLLKDICGLHKSTDSLTLCIVNLTI
jgi:hypothetical protein